MRLLELSDVILMDGVKNSVDSLAVILPSRRIGKLNIKSTVIMKESLLLDFSHNCFTQMQEELLMQFPQSWWFLFPDNKLKKLMDNPPRLIGLLDISDNDLNLNSLMPFANSFILRLNISGNPSLNSLSRDHILKQLHQVWVLNNDFVKTEETTSWGDKNAPVEKNSFLSGGWQVPQLISDKQRDMFDIVMNEIPEKNQSADYFKLDYLLDDYSFQAYVHNTAAGTVLGENKPMPTVNCNDILLMRHSDRLDLAVLLTTRLFYQVPELVFKDTMEKLLVSYMPLTAIRDLNLLPTFAITAIISLIVRISRRELTELRQHSSFISKTNIPGLIRGKGLFTTNSPPSRDNSGFRFLKSVRYFLSRDLVQVIPPSHTPVQTQQPGGGGVSQEPSASNHYSELELEILKSLNDIPTLATFPAKNTRAYQDWIPFIARHTLVMMTKVPSCPPLTRCQTSMSAQHTYNQLEDILSAASMTYEDMNITANGPTQDGRVSLTQSNSVLAFGAGLPTASCTALQWNRNNTLSREYIKPWSEQSAISRQQSQEEEEEEEEGNDVASLLSHMSHDIGDLSIEASDGLPDMSETDHQHRQKNKSSADKAPQIPLIRVSAVTENPYVLDDDLEDMTAGGGGGGGGGGDMTPASVQKEGRPWSMSQQTTGSASRNGQATKSLENMYLDAVNDSSSVVQGEQRDTNTGTGSDGGNVLSPLEMPLSPLVMAPVVMSPLHHTTHGKIKKINSSRPNSPAIVSGFSAPDEQFNQFVLASPRRMEHWRATAGKQWRDIDLAPVLVHPLSKYPVYMKRKPRHGHSMDGDGPEMEEEEDSHSEYDVLPADKKDWQLHVKEHQPNTFEVEDSGYAQYRHHVYEENRKHEDIKALADQMKNENLSQKASAKLISNYIKSKDPNESKKELLREMGTTRNLRFQQDMTANLKREILRQRREEEQRRHYSYRGIKLEGGSSMVSQESYATLETKNSMLSNVKLGVDLNHVSWNTFVKKEPKLPSLETVCASRPLAISASDGSNTFLTEPMSCRKDKSRPSSPSKTPLSFVPNPIPLRPDHVFQEQYAGTGEERGWDTSIPLAKHVQKALKYSSVYTNSAEVDWGVILTSGKAPAAWFPRQEKATFTLAEHTPVNVARMEQQLQLSPREHPPPATAATYPIIPKTMTVQSPATSSAPPSRPLTNSNEEDDFFENKNKNKRDNDNNDDNNAIPFSTGRPSSSSRRRSYRPDKSRKKVTEVPKRVTVPAFTSNFTNLSLRERDPIFVEITEIDDTSSSTCKHSSLADADESKSIFNGSVKSTDIQQEYIRSLTVSVTSPNGASVAGEILSSAGGAPAPWEGASIGSASLSCGSSAKRGNAIKKAATLKRQQLEDLSRCSTKGSQLNDHERSSYAIPVLKVPPSALLQPSLNFATRKRPYHPRVLAQIDPLEARWVKDKGVARERLSGQTPISVCRPVTNVRPINPAFRIKKSRLVSNSQDFESLI